MRGSDFVAVALLAALLLVVGGLMSRFRAPMFLRERLLLGAGAWFAGSVWSAVGGRWFTALMFAIPGVASLVAFLRSDGERGRRSI